VEHGYRGALMRRALFTLICLLAGTGFAFPAGSDRSPEILDQFHRYFGGPGSKPDFIEVTPAADSYDVTVRWNRLIDRFHLPSGISLDIADYGMRMTPLSDGTWQVDSAQTPSPMTVRFGERALSLRWDGVRFDGIFDPSLHALAHFEESIDSIDTTVSDPPAVQTTHVEGAVMTGSATSDGNGAVNVVMSGTRRSFVTNDSAPLSEGQPPLTLTFGSDRAAFGLAIDSLRTSEMANLLAYIVDRSQDPTPTLDNEQIKGMLTELLPVCERVEEQSTMQQFYVDSPVGRFGIAELGGSFAVTGLVPGSEASFALKAEGASFPEGLVPDWAHGLIANEVDLGVDVSGFDLDAPARYLLSELDIGRTPMLDDVDLQHAVALIGGDHITFTLKPSTIVSPLLTLRVSGALALKPPKPEGTFTITAEGLDDAVAALSSAANDPDAAKILGVLSLARSMAKPGADGASEFLIEMKADGSVSVNGTTVKPPDGQPL
jgi:hypothetical protein